MIFLLFEHLHGLGSVAGNVKRYAYLAEKAADNGLACDVVWCEYDLADHYL